jgi:hypothetical protein
MFLVFGLNAGEESSNIRLPLGVKYHLQRRESVLQFRGLSATPPNRANCVRGESATQVVGV